MKSGMRVVLMFVLGASSSAVACSKSGQGQNQQSAEPKSAEGTAEAPAKPPEAPVKAPVKAPAAGHFAGETMSSYELCRAFLAADSTKGIAECAQGVATAAQSATANAPEAAREAMAAVVTAAEALAKSPADDIAVMRNNFGELSRAVLAMLAGAPDVAKGYHVFECPMTKGFQRWVQPDAELANPYQGTKMLTCGSEVQP